MLAETILDSKHDLAELFLSSVGESSSHVGEAFGRFDLLPGEEKCGSPVYRQAHSKEIPTKEEYLLYR